MKIGKVHAREILDSRGNPTVEVVVSLDDGSRGRASVPSGASTGSHEAHELRDNDPARYGGKGVQKAVGHVNTVISQAITAREFNSQAELDQALVELDGTKNKERLGANALLGVSLAFAHAAAQSTDQPLYAYARSLAKSPRPLSLPVPMCNVINGGKHASGSTDIQEFMIMPVGASKFSEALRMATEVFHVLGDVLREKGYSTTVGDEGGYAPAVKHGNREALELIARGVQKAGYTLGQDIVFALDVAASELRREQTYEFATEGKQLSAEEMVSFYQELARDFPVKSIEDGLDENDWDHWRALTKELGSQLQLVGDDLLVTNVDFLRKAIEQNAANAILVKVNQIGTLTEAVQAVDMAHAADWRAIISHRSGETEDTTIAHLAVGLGTGEIKTGSLSRTDRVAKYNELLRIEEALGSEAVYVGNQLFRT